VHWIYYLETDPKIKTFDLVSKNDQNNERFWLADVILSDGSRIAHKFVDRFLAEENEAKKLPRGNFRSEDLRAKDRIFIDEDIQSVVKVSQRWLKPIAFASVLRSHGYPHQTTMLLEFFRLHVNGEIGQILEDPKISKFDPALILGLTTRLAIKGSIQLDLSISGFGNKTPWFLSIS
jgi:hypothetical protein